LWMEAEGAGEQGAGGGSGSVRMPLAQQQQQQRCARRGLCGLPVLPRPRVQVAHLWDGSVRLNGKLEGVAAAVKRCLSGPSRWCCCCSKESSGRRAKHNTRCRQVVKNQTKAPPGRIRPLQDISLWGSDQGFSKQCVKQRAMVDIPAILNSISVHPDTQHFPYCTQH
jgi:hypothetical protein